MGAVKMETSSQNRGVHYLESYNYSDIWCIETMIKNRIKLDDSFKARLFESSNPFEASDIPDFKELIMVMYIDLENLIKQAEITKTELLVINKLMIGYDFDDIDELYLASDELKAQSVLRQVANKIKVANDSNRIKWYERNGIAVRKKQCSECGETKIISEFSPNKGGRDGVHPKCKSCRTKKK